MNNVTFVLNNGGDDCWDTLGVGMTDYTISAPGVYMLSNGVGTRCDLFYLQKFLFLLFLPNDARVTSNYSLQTSGIPVLRVLDYALDQAISYWIKKNKIKRLLTLFAPYIS